MAYDKKLGYDPDIDYAAEYAKATDPMMRQSLAQGRAAKVAALKAAGNYNPEWDAAWDSIYSANPISGMDSSGSFGEWGNTPVGQLFGSTTKQTAAPKTTTPTTPVTQNAYTAPKQSYVAPTIENPYIALQKQSEQNLANIKQSQTSQVNQMYDNQAKQAYIQREQNKANMPKQLAAQGITGGMAESTAARIGTAYGNQLSTNEAARMGAINDINIASSQQAIQMAMDYADRIIAQQNADRSFNRGVYESDRGFAYQQGRDSVADGQWQSAFDRGIYESDRGYNYQVGRDAVGDSQWDKSFNRGIYEYDTHRTDNLNQQALDNAYRSDIYNRGIYEFDANRGDRLTQQGIDNAYRDGVFNRGIYEYDTNRSDNLNQTAVDNAYRSKLFDYNAGQDAINNALKQQTATSLPYSMGGYVKNIVDTYTKSDGKYDLIGALNKAYDGGLISAADYAAALIQSGIDPDAKEKAAATAAATEQNKANASATLQGWTDNPANLGYGPLSESNLQELIDSGKVQGKYENGRFYYKRV